MAEPLAYSDNENFVIGVAKSYIETLYPGLDNPDRQFKFTLKLKSWIEEHVWKYSFLCNFIDNGGRIFFNIYLEDNEIKNVKKGTPKSAEDPKAGLNIEELTPPVYPDMSWVKEAKKSAKVKAEEKRKRQLKERLEKLEKMKGKILSELSLSDLYDEVKICTKCNNEYGLDIGNNKDNGLCPFCSGIIKKREEKLYNEEVLKEEVSIDEVDTTINNNNNENEVPKPLNTSESDINIDSSGNN